MKKMTWLVLLAVALALLAGCVRSPTRLLRGDEQVVRARVGEGFAVTLLANPTTGYQWRNAESRAADLVRFVSRDFTASVPGRVGGGGTEIWRFMALRPGTAFIDFEYVRPWEQNNAPVQRQTVIVEILP